MAKNNIKAVAEHLAKAEDRKVAAYQIIFDAKVTDASKIQPHEVYTNLIPVRPDEKRITWNPENTHVLAVSFMDKSIYENYWEKFIKNDQLNLAKNRNSWITLAPELKNLLKKHRRSRSLLTISDRARQILGLPPAKNSVEKVIVEFWIKPSDLLRPCPDNQIDDKQCVPDFFHLGEDVFEKELPQKGQDVLTQTEPEKIYKEWYLENRANSYTKYPFPWTRLGYTLDYKGKKQKGVGATEYINRGGAQILINKVCTPEEYVAD